MQKFIFSIFFVAVFITWIVCIWQFVFYKNANFSKTAIAGPVTHSSVQVISPKKVLGESISISPAKQMITPTPLPLKRDFILEAINEYRKQHGLTPVVYNDSTCSFAQIRAGEIVNDFTHSGFQKRLANHTLPYPNYALVTENIAETSDYTQVVQLWANSPGHAKNMQADTPYVCVESSGDFYAYEGWKPL